MQPTKLPIAPRIAATLSGIALISLLHACQSLPPNAELLAELFTQQDRRLVATAPLAKQLRHPDASVRRFAVRALGSHRHLRAVGPLLRGLRDRDRSVQLAAIFALGLQPGPDRWENLERFASSADPELAVAALASLRPNDRGARAHLPRLLVHADAAIAGAAALATVRLYGDRLRHPNLPTPFEDQRRLTDLIAAALSKHGAAAVRWRLVYALAHLVLEPGFDTLFAVATNTREDRFARIFAIRGLVALPSMDDGRDFEISRNLMRITKEDDPKIVYEAVRALGKIESKRTGRARYDREAVARVLLTLVAHENVHVRAAALQTLPAFHSQRPAVERALAALECADVTTEAHRIEALGRLDPDHLHPQVGSAALSRDWPVRGAAATAAGGYPWPQAQRVLTRLVTDRDLRVRIAAITALGNFPTEPRPSDIARGLLGERDLAIRETAADTLGRLRDDSAIPALIAAYRDSDGIEFAEARMHLLRACATLGPRATKTLAICREALNDKVLFVRQAAAAILKNAQQPRSVVEAQPDLITPKLGEDIAWDFFASRPIVRVTTRHGSFEITLRPDLAPIHCHSLLSLVRSGKYRGRVFHRVVPNFVVQGGDDRRDGFGNTAYHGGRLRDEISATPFRNGTVGMPKSEYRDTGGGQLFVTTVPTPHLDRKYTVVGRITRGSDVVERLVPGDSITAISIIRE